MRTSPLLSVLLGGCFVAAAPVRVVETTYTVNQQAVMLAPGAPAGTSMPALPLQTASLAAGASYAPVEGPPNGFGHVVIPPTGTARGSVRVGRWAELATTFEVGPGSAAIDTRSGDQSPLSGVLWRGGVDYRLPLAEPERGVGFDLLCGLDLRSVSVVQAKTKHVAVFENEQLVEESTWNRTDDGKHVHLGSAIGVAMHVPVPQVHARVTFGIAGQTMPTYVAKDVQQETCTTTFSHEECSGSIDLERPRPGVGFVATPALGVSTALGESWQVHVQGYGLLGEPAVAHPVGVQVLLSQQIRTGG